jgi:hypothetical protein
MWSMFVRSRALEQILIGRNLKSTDFIHDYGLFTDIEYIV